MSAATKAVQSAATELQGLIDNPTPDWPDRFEKIIDNLRDTLEEVLDA